jgi:hypothetical protein
MQLLIIEEEEPISECARCVLQDESIKFNNSAKKKAPQSLQKFTLIDPREIELPTSIKNL